MPGAPSAAGLLAGLELFDVAGAVHLTDDLALVTSASLLPQVIEAPAAFGAVAAASACSGIFAQGGDVVAAQALAAFPDDVSERTIRGMFKAAAAVIADAGGDVSKTHLVRADEPLFGLAVQGLVHPDRVLPQDGARAGDVVVLSKPIGTGVVLAGGTDEEQARAIDGMRMLNRLAGQRLVEAGEACHAVTEVGTAGLLGTAHRLAERSGVCIELDGEMVPCYRGAKQVAKTGLQAAGAADNRASFEALVALGPDLGAAMEILAFDPQTSGGLLAAVEPDDVSALVDAGFRPIGTVRDVGVDDDGYATEPMVQLT